MSAEVVTPTTTTTIAPEEEDELCLICRQEGNDDELLLCDGCDKPFHTFCLGGCLCCGEKPKSSAMTKPFVIPDGDWFCKLCQDQPPALDGTAKSSVFAWGDNAACQLGLNAAEKKKASTAPSTCVFDPTRVTALSALPVSLVSIGNDFTVVATTAGELYSVGSGCNGQLGHAGVMHEILPNWRRITTLDRVNVSKSEGDITTLKSGKNFTLAITSDGQMYSFGSGNVGQLGHQDNKNQKKPKKNSALRQMETWVDLVTCGNDFVLMTSGRVAEDDQFCTDKPGVFMSMGGNNHGQLGDGSGRNQWVPQRLNKEGEEVTSHPEEKDEDPEEFMLGRDILAVAAGAAHSVALTSMGGVWTWGYGQSGQIAHALPPVPVGRNAFFKPQFRVLYPRFVQSLRQEVISLIACGDNHTLAYAKGSGKLYSWGANKTGQLGVGQTDHALEMSETPLVITALGGLPLRALDCGSEHSLALTTSGSVYAWGNNTKGQCGVGASESLSLVTTPSLVPHLGPHINAIAAGSHVSFAFVKGKASVKRPVSASEKGKGSKKKKTT